jgi:hypothetical protein
MQHDALYNGPDRRASPRRQVEVPARWEVAGRGGHDATVTDISTGGCFVLTDGTAGEGELVRLDLSPPKGEPLSLWGHVVYSFEQIGFAVRFVPSSQGGALAKLKQLFLNSR